MILGIETAVERVGVALGDSRGVTAAATLASDRRHAESLTPMIKFVLDQAGLSMRDLSAVAVDAGPGLFTGMRVGIAAAEALAWALEIPIIGVCSLDVAAINAVTSHSASPDTVAVALDARRGEVYWALYRTSESAFPVRLSEPVVGAPDDLAVHLADRAEDVVCVGSGFHRYPETFDAPWMQVLGADHSLPSPENVVRLGVARAVDDDASTRTVEPIYLRAPDAEINWQTREAAR